MKLYIKLFIASLFLFSGMQMFSQAEKETDTLTTIEKKHPLLVDKFSFTVGAYSSFKTIGVGANGSSNNDIIDFDEKVDFNNNETTPFFLFNWRFAKKWSLTAEYFGVKNAITTNFEDDFEWNGYDFVAGLNINAGFDLEMYRVMIGRTISKGLKHELGLGLGVHVLDIQTYIEGQAYIIGEGTEIDATGVKSIIDVVAPLPNVGVWYLYAPSHKWIFNTRLDWFGIKVGDYTGTMWNFAAGANYQFHKNIGVGLKYRYFDFTATVDNEKWDGKLTMIFHGPLLTLNANF